MKHFHTLTVTGGKKMNTTDTIIDQVNGEELYQIETMADGARNTGYKSTYNAIAEIVAEEESNEDTNK